MQNVVYDICGEERSLLFAEAWGWTFSELGQNIKWVDAQSMTSLTTTHRNYAIQKKDTSGINPHPPS